MLLDSPCAAPIPPPAELAHYQESAGGVSPDERCSVLLTAHSLGKKGERRAAGIVPRELSSCIARLFPVRTTTPPYIFRRESCQSNRA